MQVSKIPPFYNAIKFLWLLDASKKADFFLSYQNLEYQVYSENNRTF